MIGNRNTGLLSFGEDADSGEAIAVKKKAMTRPDCEISLDNAPEMVY
jgi:hypothetical protein